MTPSKELKCAVRRCAGMLAGVVFVLAMGGFALGVSGPAFADSGSGGPVPADKERVGDDRAAALEIDEASKMVDAGDTSAVIPKLLATIAKYPSTESAHEARYWLARAYYKIGGYRDAIELFKEYLKLSPDGKHAAESNDYIAKLTEEYQQKFLSTEQLDANIKTLTDELAQSPDNLGSQLALADLYWKRGDYAKAGDIYKNVVAKHPDQANDLTIRARVEFQPNGEVTVLTPAEIQRRQAESQPLVVINTQSFQSGRDLFTRETRFYSVTGQVVNRCDSVLNGVEVTVTIYGFGTKVYDTTTVNIGRMSPGEIRAFSVRFNNFDNIENVNRFECTTSYQR